MKIYKEHNRAINDIAIKSPDFNFLENGIDAISENYYKQALESIETTKDLILTPCFGATIFKRDMTFFKIDNENSMVFFSYFLGKVMSQVIINEGVVEEFVVDIDNPHFKELNMDTKHYINLCYKHLLALALFKEYAKIESKVINRKKTLKNINETVKNNTSYNVNYLTTNYYTNSVRTESFSVKGHFRIQPYKSRNTKELIWINSFEKQGYNKAASKTDLIK